MQRRLSLRLHVAMPLMALAVLDAQRVTHAKELQPRLQPRCPTAATPVALLPDRKLKTMSQWSLPVFVRELLWQSSGACTYQPAPLKIVQAP
eukprot:scaffold124640_cov20-Tisochrysis_lutea.AAC.1